MTFDLLASVARLRLPVGMRVRRPLDEDAQSLRGVEDKLLIL